MSSDSPLVAPPLPAVPNFPREHAKLVHAAQEFEAQLVASLLGEIQAGLKSFGAEAESPGSDTADALALQAISTGIAAGGGFGFAKMLVSYLEGDRRIDHQPVLPQPLNPSATATYEGVAAK